MSMPASLFRVCRRLFTVNGCLQNVVLVVILLLGSFKGFAAIFKKRARRPAFGAVHVIVHLTFHVFSTAFVCPRGSMSVPTTWKFPATGPFPPSVGSLLISASFPVSAVMPSSVFRRHQPVGMRW